jgi:hypothetical protein
VLSSVHLILWDLMIQVVNFLDAIINVGSVETYNSYLMCPGKHEDFSFTVLSCYSISLQVSFQLFTVIVENRGVLFGNQLYTRLSFLAWQPLSSLE